MTYKGLLSVLITVFSISISSTMHSKQFALSQFNTAWQELKPNNAGVNWIEFNRARKGFVAVRHKELAQSNMWIDNACTTFFRKLKHKKFAPFVQKIEVEDGTTVFFHGDLHGDVHSLLEFLISLQERSLLDDDLTITDKKTKIIFLGDYVDRGKHGVETLYLLWRLKIANPNSVYMIRGNHEDVAICTYYGFRAELIKKFGKKDFTKIYDTYNYLPVALYLGAQNKDGKDFIQCCHGGPECIDQAALLESEKLCAYLLIERCTRKTKIDLFPQILKNEVKDGLFGNEDCILDKPLDCGFMWNDFLVDAGGISYFQPGRGFVWSKNMTHALLKVDSTEHAHIRGIFRAHQHTSSIDSRTNGGQLMRLILNEDNVLPETDTGIGKLWVPENNQPKEGALWDGIVCTFNVAPNAGYAMNHDDGQLFDYDSYGELHINGEFDNWFLKVHRNKHPMR